MTERKGQFDQDETPEDVASLYSWANLQGAKYRDFSASRAQTREKARQRVEQATEEERLRARAPAEPQRSVDPVRDREPSQSPHPPPAPPLSEPSHLDDLAAISRGFAAPPQYRSAPPRTSPSPMREESFTPPRNPWPASIPVNPRAAQPG